MAGSKRQITRNRTSYSCQRCRQRKVKCDKVHPICGACQKSGEECVYASIDNEQADHDQGGQDGANAKKRKQPITHSEHEEDAQSEDPGDVAGLDRQLEQLKTLLNRLSNITGLNDDGGNGASNFESIDTAQGKHPRDEAAITTALNHHHQSYQPNLEAISTQLDRLTNLLSVQQYDAQVRTSNHVSSQGHEQTSDTYLHVPNEHQRNAIFRSWLSSVYPVLPIVDPNLALMSYRTFHFWYTHGLEKNVANPVEDHIPLIYAIYYAGVMAMSLRGIRKWFPGLTRQHLLGRFRKQFSHILQVSSKISANPITIAAKLMMRYMGDTSSSHTSNIGASTELVRMAYSVNLHRERFSDSQDKHLAELRRRLWWEVVNLDNLESTAANLPPSIDTRYCDISMLNEIKDVKLGTIEADQYTAALQEGRTPDAADDPGNNELSSMISVTYLVMKIRTVVMSHARQLLNINLSAKPKTKEDMQEMRKSLREVLEFVGSSIARIPSKGIPELDFPPLQGKPGQSVAFDHAALWGDDLISCEVEAISGSFVSLEPWKMPYAIQYRQALIAFHKWARIMLSMLIDQIHCFSYAPFLSNSRTKVWVSARQCALRSAHSCLRKFNALAVDLSLERFHWTWPSMYQPTHACIIILLDVYERPSSQEAARSRALVDEMLSLSSPDHGLVGGQDGFTNLRPCQEGGEEAYAMLAQLRIKGWYKAGLDPSVLWTEQDQIDVGVARPPTNAEKLAQSIREDVMLEVSPNGEPHPDLMRPILAERAKEYFHPSEAGLPETVDGPNTCVEAIGAAPLRTQNGRKLLRARPDQERVPRKPPTRLSANDTSADIYRFRPPSELSDVGELIKRIKSFKHSSQAAQAENSVTLGQETAAANSDLTNYLAQQLPQSTETYTTTSTGNGTTATTTDQIRNQPQLGSPPSANDMHLDSISPGHPPSLHNGTQMLHTSNHFPVISQQMDAPASTANPPSNSLETQDQAPLNFDFDLDFDWAKWDEMFSHVLDANSFENIDFDFDAMHTDEHVT